ncbi:MAG: hypothetical protein L0322_15975, partial [Chloroflexi bacterium]|nr:hypothetical protein [Chloroflexota bacterium]
MKKLAIAKLMTLVMTMWAVAIALGQGTPYQPGNSRGLFVVEDALAQFNALKHHGEALAWILPEALGAPDPSIPDHYQGLARYPGEGAPIFYVTQKDDDDPIPPQAEGPGGYLHVFRFGTRPTDGERLRSNLQVIGSDTKHTQPSSSDIWQRSIRFDGSLQIDGQSLPAYVHPGGLAIVDDILFVSLDSPHSGGSPAGQIVLFDLAAGREHPLPIQALPLNHSIDNLAVTEQEDGTFLVWTNGGGGEATYFYETSGPNLRDDNLALALVQRLDHHSSTDYDGAGESWPGGGVLDGHEAHQSSTFLREPDGTLYMIAMRHVGAVDVGSDYADLYRVDPKTAGGFKLTRLRTRNFHCEFRMSGGPSETDARICNFAAADNAYVSPSGELILYSMPHDDEDSWDIDGVRLGEFRHRDVNREDSPLRLPAANANGPYTVNEGGAVTLSGSGWAAGDRPWVELYDNEYWDDRSIVVDYDDRFLLELNNFDHLDGFTDKTTSIRWRMPIGLDAELFDDENFDDRRIILRGTGQTESIGHLDPQVVVPGVVEHPGRSAGDELGFGDKTSSMRFVGAPANNPVSLAWDLDGDGLFGETGAAAIRGDEVGATVTFSAAGLDGPGQLIVVLRVTAAGVSSDNVAVINVANVSPTAGFANTSGDIIEREDAVLVFNNQHDPSLADISAGFSYSYDCTDDGAFESLDSPASEFSCHFPVAGAFTARGRIKDKDGGFTDYTTSITVLTPAEAIIRLVDTVEGMNLQQGIDNNLDAKLQAALNALTELNANNSVAAMNTLQAFINAVEAQRNDKLTNEQA